ncbi:hypothetical protein AGMMS50239_19160 [Bacteroidia bacterium]|nr:hypothetical protein AGMMS50239_19160 [Bacteroidia bacterium]GHV32680.1 hypothetical protein FACS1894177_08970 [Bacteroidia bacterium]
MIHNEKWLPIIDESGKVYGKIAYSQSMQMKNQYLHPIVRIALVHNGKIFLREKENGEANDKSCLDYPFERSVFYKETIDKAVTKTFQSNGSKTDINCNYLFRYVHRNEEMHRMVYFYVCNIREDSLLEKINQSNGKWWTSKQIKENLKTGLFSDFFENEFEFLDSTVLAIDK